MSLSVRAGSAWRQLNHELSSRLLSLLRDSTFPSRHQLSFTSRQTIHNSEQQNECTNYILQPFTPTKSFLFSTLLSLNILFLHQICIPLIKLNYFWLPNILCRWLSTENTWLWTSNDTVSLKHELQPSRRHLQANYRPLLQNRAEIKCWFLFLQLLTSTQ